MKLEDFYDSHYVTMKKMYMYIYIYGLNSKKINDRH